MHLLNSSTLKLSVFEGDRIPQYAILSHTWDDEELSFNDIQDENPERFAGYAKIKAACLLAASDDLKWIWIDTCCIDKRSSAELSEAINSMYRWYKKYSVCYAYMSDLSLHMSHTSRTGSEKPVKFQDSRWFSRGWTLQELLAPRSVLFYDKDWVEIGTEFSLSTEICSATGIFEGHLVGPFEASIAQKMSWASKRRTTRIEDVAYCLMGLFDVNMALLYGEGAKAFRRLQEEILKTCSDESIFAWTNDDVHVAGMLAVSPRDFQNSGNFIPMAVQLGNQSSDDIIRYSISNLGLSLQIHYLQRQHSAARHRFIDAFLKCGNGTSNLVLRLRIKSDQNSTNMALKVGGGHALIKESVLYGKHRATDTFCLPLHSVARNKALRFYPLLTNSSHKIMIVNFASPAARKLLLSDDPKTSPFIKEHDQRILLNVQEYLKPTVSDVSLHFHHSESGQRIMLKFPVQFSGKYERHGRDFDQRVETRLATGDYLWIAVKRLSVEHVYGQSLAELVIDLDILDFSRLTILGGPTQGPQVEFPADIDIGIDLTECLSL